ncbi:MAG: PBPRA1643 family SWIM/SEC-C metal-binding motif protein [Motiliproteus sp.]
MSKFFFKGRIEKRPEYGSCGFNTKRVSKLGTETNPLTLVVNSEERRAEVEALVVEHSLCASIAVDPEAEENLAEFDGVLNKPQTQTFANTPGRNDPCSCGSGKKYKKCCG